MRADRLVSLLLLLQNEKRHTAEALAERLQVSPRTVYRDLDALSASGVPVYAQRGRHGGIALLPGWRTNLTGLTEQEIQALSVAHSGDALEALGLSAPLEHGLIKLAAALPPLQQASAEHARQRLHLDGTPWFGSKEAVPHLGVLREAVFRDQRVRLGYRDFDGRRSMRTVDALGLVIKADRWYLVAGTDRGPSVFRGARVANAKLLDQTFTRPAEFDLRGFWKAWCRRFATERPSYAVKLRLDPEAAEALAAMRPGEEARRIRRARKSKDGTRTTTIDFERQSIALAQLIELGRGAEVLAPEALRERLRSLGGDLRAVYGDGKRSPTSPLRRR